MIISLLIKGFFYILQSYVNYKLVQYFNKLHDPKILNEVKKTLEISSIKLLEIIDSLPVKEKEETEDSPGDQNSLFKPILTNPSLLKILDNLSPKKRDLN